MQSQFEVPGEIDLLVFFGVGPIDRAAQDGYWCYEVSDVRGVKLQFSFNVYERSVQTVLSVDEVAVVIVSHEGAERMLVRDGKLRCEFSTGGDRTTLTLESVRSFQSFGRPCGRSNYLSMRRGGSTVSYTPFDLPKTITQSTGTVTLE
jgi:hypothetical protein